MMSVSDLFYGGREPVWIVHTPNSAQKSNVHNPQTPQSAIRGGVDLMNYHSPYNSSSPMMEFKVSLCCEACEERVKHALLKVDGVDSVKCNTMDQRVLVTGNAAPADVLRIVRKLHKNSKLLSTSSNGFKNMNPSPRYISPKYSTPRYNPSPIYSTPKYE